MTNTSPSTLHDVARGSGVRAVSERQYGGMTRAHHDSPRTDGLSFMAGEIPHSTRRSRRHTGFKKACFALKQIRFRYVMPGSITRVAVLLGMALGYCQDWRTTVASRHIAAPSSVANQTRRRWYIIDCDMFSVRMEQETCGMAPSYRSTAPQTTSTVVATFQMSMARTDDM